jgi:hypothetical protein
MKDLPFLPPIRPSLADGADFGRLLFPRWACGLIFQRFA